MTFSYDLTVLADTSDADYNLTYCRYRLGDTTQLSGSGATGRGILADEEINATLARFGDSPGQALPELCRSILGAIAKDVDKDAGGMRTTRTQKTTHYQALLRQLELEAMGAVEPYAGGISIAEKEASEADTDIPEDAFTRDQFVDTSL